MASAPTSRRSIGAKGWLLFLLPLPLLLKAAMALWGGELVTFAVNGGGFVLLLLGAWSIRRGFGQTMRRRVGRPTPFKMVGAGLIGVGTALIAWLAVGQGLPIAVCFGLGAVLGCYLVYGFDLDGKRSAKGDVGAALTEAYAKLDRIEAAGRQISSPEFSDRMARIVAWAEKILETIAEDPGDLRRARKFLNVYLDGVYEVTEKYARTHPKTESAELEDSFRTLLADMEQVSEEQYRQLIDDDVVDLDVQIEVLTTRLKREGVV